MSARLPGQCGRRPGCSANRFIPATRRRRSGLAVSGSPCCGREGWGQGADTPSLARPAGPTLGAPTCPQHLDCGAPPLGFLVWQILWDLRVCASNKLPDAAVAVALGTLVLPNAFLRGHRFTFGFKCLLAVKGFTQEQNREFFHLPLTSGSFELRGHSLQVGRRVKREIYCYYLQHLLS